MVKGILAFLGTVAGLFGKFVDRGDRADAESAGAAKQVAEDQKEAIRAKDEQLEDAVNRRPGDARRRLRDGSF